MHTINSKNNNKIKDLVKLRDDSAFRDSMSSFIIEGERIIKDAPAEFIDEIFVSSNYIDKFKDIIDKYNNDKVFVLSGDSFDKIKGTVNSQGIIATARYNLCKSINELNLNNSYFGLLLDNVSDPGNLGTILRLAEATKVDFIVLANNCCDIYNSKVIRASMSSIFRTKVYKSSNILDDIKTFKNNNFKLFSTCLDLDSVSLKETIFDKKFIIAFGNEANGISDLVLNNSDAKIKIPMFGNIESLNVAISAGIVCYEVMRQNNFYEN